MADRLMRALAYDGQVRVSAVICTDAVETARKRHDAFPTAIAALGRTMASTLLLSWGLKGEGSITLRIFGDGPLGGIIVTGDAHGNIKGYVQGEIDADIQGILIGDANVSLKSIIPGRDATAEIVDEEGKPVEQVGKEEESNEA